MNTFDWSSNRITTPALPDFMYTDNKPGKLIPEPDKRVKDLPPDTGVRTKPILYRTKPILYFYPSYSVDSSVGIEVRFKYGYANAWWPQVNVYRTPDEVAKASPLDSEIWRKRREDVQRRSSPMPRIPDDKRFELVWEELKLTKEMPPGLSLPGKELPEDHWVKRARMVDSYYVSNGKEIEKFVFYEGATQETPLITILPLEEYHFVNVGEYSNYIHHIVNVGEH